jgi:hypothetical protein
MGPTVGNTATVSRRSRALVFGVLAGCLVWAGLALARPAPGPIVQVSTAGEYAESPVIGVDAAGEETVAWTDYLSSDPAQFAVATATRRAGTSAWTVPTLVSDFNGGSDQPVLALAPSGAGVIAWVQVVPSGPTETVFALEAVTRPSASAAWTAPVQVASAASGVSGASIGIDRAGEITAVWNTGFGTNSAIEVADASAATGRWGQPQLLAAAGQGGFGSAADRRRSRRCDGGVAAGRRPDQPRQVRADPSLRRAGQLPLGPRSMADAHDRRALFGAVRESGCERVGANDAGDRA